jgi:hypothetical protein
MTNKLNLLVNGCSFSRGPTSWPYHLQNVNVTNLACAGAGNSYIHDTTITELASRSYDFVAVMWTGIARVDLQVEDIKQFGQSKYTSQYQSTQNDWANKIMEPVNDQDYVEKNWVFGCGHINGESALLSTRVFDSIYRYQSDIQFARGLLVKMISLQSVLKQLDIPYLFMYYQDYEPVLKQFLNLYNMLDQRQIFNSNNINNIAKENNWYEDDQSHPNKIAHAEWAKLITLLVNKY